MDRARVVILSGGSLFAQGVASRLQQHTDHIDLHRVDCQEPGALEQIIAVQPAVVILDATDPRIDQACPLTKLLQALPSLKVIRLDSQQDHVQIVTSQQRQAAEVRDLIQLIES
ncbi:MAG TPA: hypothetical protein VJG32_14935 [Anaerolineae bacterium]|nr:hypothetical protein [Anaerolineae bacterium]